MCYFLLCPLQVEALAALGSGGRNWDDYILVSQDEGPPSPREESRAEPTTVGGAQPVRVPKSGRGCGPGQEGPFQDPLMGRVAAEPAGGASGSSVALGSSPDEDGRDSGFTIVTPADL